MSVFFLLFITFYLYLYVEKLLQPKFLPCLVIVELVKDVAHGGGFGLAHHEVHVGEGKLHVARTADTVWGSLIPLLGESECVRSRICL